MSLPRRLFISATLTTLACTSGSSGDPDQVGSATDAAGSTGGGGGESAGSANASDGGASSGGGQDGGSSDSGQGSGGNTEVAGAFPVGLAVSSPTTPLHGGGMGPGPMGPMNPMPQRAALGFASTSQATQAAAGTTPDGFSASLRPQGVATLTSGKPYAEKIAELETMLSGADCDLVLGGLGPGYNPQCYGPWMDYQNHPDDMTGTMGDGMFPSGDLGLWLAEEPGGQACAAVKLNALVDEVALKVDYGLYLAANLQCLMVVEGVALPDIGESLDRTDSVNTSLSATNTGVTVTSATISRGDDDSGRSVFTYDFAISIDSGGMGPSMDVTTTLDHAADLSDASDYRGHIMTYVDQSDGSSGMGGSMGSIQAYSVDYAQDTSGLRYDVLGAGYDPISADAADPFDADGNVDFSTDWSGNATRAAVELDPDSGSATVAFAWQAGHGDSNTRVFNVSVDFDTADHGAGCGFFGFGEPFSGSGPADASISTFICNWAGPGNSHTGEVGMAQKQCMETDSAGLFAVTESHITYGPVNDCDTTEDPDFAYRLPNETDYVTDPLAEDLVELASDADYASWAPPTSP